MADTFSRTGRLRKGYAPDQVDEFLSLAKESYADMDGGSIDEDTVRAMSFSFVRNGYSPELVDAALDRLEKAFIQRRRAAVVSDDGEQAWLDHAYDQAVTLYPRLRRGNGERFSDADGVGYAKADVDELMGRISGYFDGLNDLASGEVRGAVFGRDKGAKAYDENVVDVFLDRVVSVLLAVE